MDNYGLIIGRFQPLHLGHKLLIETSLAENDKTQVFVGSANKEDVLNPYNYELRKSMLQEEFQDQVLIGALPDFPTDKEWGEYILSEIPKNVSKVTLYCGDIKNDSAVQSLLKLKSTLPFELIVKEIPRSIIPVSATQVRKWIMEGNTKKLQEYIGEKTLLLLGIKL